MLYNVLGKLAMVLLLRRIAAYTAENLIALSVVMPKAKPFALIVLNVYPDDGKLSLLFSPFIKVRMLAMVSLILSILSPFCGKYKIIFCIFIALTLINFKSWMRTTQLAEALSKSGYMPGLRLLTPKQVAIIVAHIGDP